MELEVTKEITTIFTTFHTKEKLLYIMLQKLKLYEINAHQDQNSKQLDVYSGKNRKYRKEQCLKTMQVVQDQYSTPLQRRTEMEKKKYLQDIYFLHFKILYDTPDSRVNKTISI